MTEEDYHDCPICGCAEIQDEENKRWECPCRCVELEYNPLTYMQEDTQNKHD